MSCRIQNIKPPCGYVVEGVERILFLDFDDFQGYRFQDSELYSNCNVTDILKSGDFKEISAPDLVAKYSSSGDYTHRLESFVGTLSASALSNLHLATKRRQLVLFKTNSQQWFTFGYDAGAVITYTNQTAEGFGSPVVATGNSIYPLFEYQGAIPAPFDCSTLDIEGAFPDDVSAGLGGVLPDEVYELTVDNIWSLPEGILKRRKI